MSSYSKAARGLFVLLRTDGIFTVNALSPSSSLRQYPYHYAIRAGQNLPDKEFRSKLNYIQLRSFSSSTPNAAPYIAIGIGLYLHLMHHQVFGVLVSEDSKFEVYVYLLFRHDRV